MNRRVIVGALVAACVVGAGVTAWMVFGRDDDGRAELAVLDPEGDVEYDFVIPEGTADRITRGEPVEIVPQELEVTVGESIRIRNEDDAGTSVGIFYVGAGEVVRMEFTSPGELEGVCDVHPSGTFTIKVNEA